MLGSKKKKDLEDVKEKDSFKIRFEEDKQPSSLEKDKKAAEDADPYPFKYSKRII